MLFVLIWIKKHWYGSIYKEMELEMDCLTPGILLQNVCSYKFSSAPKYVHLQRLVSQVHMMAGENIKKKYLMCQISIKMLKQHAMPNSSLHNLKIYSSKGCIKTTYHIQRWIANTAILNVQIFSKRYRFRLWVFASTGEYFYYWHWRVLPNVLQMIPRTFKNFVYYFKLSYKSSSYGYIAEWLIYI